MLRIPLLTLSFSTLVDAGSRLWEQSLAQRVQLLQQADAQSAVEVGNETLAERWFVPLVPKSDPDDEHDGIWPDRTITWAWETDDAKDTFEHHLYAAMAIWELAGLERETFKYDKIELNECKEKRDKCLIVKKGTGFDTTPARRRNRFGPSTPSMQLDDNPNIGHLDVTLNVAHELGHAWGLLHPHQNPIYWKHTNAATGAPKELAIFDADNPDQFMCENMVGYDQAVVKARTAAGGNPARAEQNIKRMCRSFLVASNYNFRGAANWAPYDPIIKAVGLNSDIDWESIMIYPSGAGGITGADGQRRNILMQPNGKAIPSNDKPSSSDIAGLKYLYGVKAKGKWPLPSKKDVDKIRIKDGPDACDVYKDIPL